MALGLNQHHLAGDYHQEAVARLLSACRILISDNLRGCILTPRPTGIPADMPGLPSATS